MSSTNSHLNLVLASSSRYRRELLGRLRLPFETFAPEVDESPLPGEAPADTAGRLAEAKAAVGKARFANAVIIGSDQVAVCEGKRLDKPGNHEAAVRQLQFARGRSVVFHTALALLNTSSGRTQSSVVPTEVRMRQLSDGEIERYLQAEPAYDCAGSAKVEGLGITLMERVESEDPTALIGLPLIALAAMLRAEGLFVP